MRRMMLAAAALLAGAPAFGESAAPTSNAAEAGKPAHSAPSNPPAKTDAGNGSTPDSRSADALAFSSEPTYDKGTAQRIKDAIKSYEDIAKQGGWLTIPTNAKVAVSKPGASDDLLRKRLIVSGDLAQDKSSGRFDQSVVEAVKHFQIRHGLAPTGTLTPRTISALNVPVDKRIQQLQASLQRLEKMNFGFGQRYVVVNIPATFAEAVENDKVVRRYRVIVGSTEKPSPTLTSQLTDIILNPTWTVPADITQADISARVRKDPAYLKRTHMEVLDEHDKPIDPRSVDWSGTHTPNFTVRQQSGPWNALGSVKIDMPNSYSVYMHDTDQRDLFKDAYRFDSHGCSRVENIRDLAAWLLSPDPKWNRAAIDAAIATGARQEIALPKKVPVAWVYLTAWMAKDQTVQFRDDVYAKDERVPQATAEEKAYFSRTAAPQPAAKRTARR